MNRHFLAFSLLCFSAAASFGQAAAAAGPDGAKHVTPAEVAPLITQKKATVIDLRSPEEFAAGHIAGARNIDCSAPDFKEKIGALDKNESYVVHCGGGARSTRALPAFKDQKFQSIMHLDGGLKAWISAGKPLGK
ncbi:MAG: Rhodanese domain protein [Chthoniobacteraceae bacterium]|nr:Rhodanese domain protein [Chthoniobacteraceae bacterium]MDB6173683.1 Rhodanese domain protein [Chthoniobacteraceae bacterium]